MVFLVAAGLLLVCLLVDIRLIALALIGFFIYLYASIANAQTIDMRNHPSAQAIAAQMHAVQPPVLMNSNSYEYQMMAFRSFDRACETTGDPQFCIASNDAYNKAMDIKAHANYIASPKSRYQQLDEACRGGHGDDPQTRKACKKRDAMDKAGQ